jgi:hypothetical protein
VDGMLQEMPDRVVELVDELLREKDAPSSFTQQQSSSGANIVLNIWDFAGQAAYYTTHQVCSWSKSSAVHPKLLLQVFLSSRAIYIIVFNLCHDLSKTTCISSLNDTVGASFDRIQLCILTIQNNEMTHLEYMDLWMHSIHAHSAQNTRGSVDNTTLSPPIFIVGTHRNSVHEEDIMQEKIVSQMFKSCFLLTCAAFSGGRKTAASAGHGERQAV